MTQKKEGKGFVKRNQGVPIGQYVYPFTLTLPSQNLHSTFTLDSNNSDQTFLEIKWELEASFNQEFDDCVLETKREI
jgi:hypothetical protein